MSVYDIYSLPILQYVLKKTFQYSIEGEFLTLSSNGDYFITPSEYDVLICVLIKGHVCQLDTTLNITEKISLHRHFLGLTSHINIMD